MKRKWVFFLLICSKIYFMSSLVLAWVPVHKGITIIASLFRLHWLAVAYSFGLLDRLMWTGRRGQNRCPCNFRFSYLGYLLDLICNKLLNFRRSVRRSWNLKDTWCFVLAFSRNLVTLPLFCQEDVVQRPCCCFFWGLKYTFLVT